MVRRVFRRKAGGWAMCESLEVRRLLSTIYSASMTFDPGWTLDTIAGVGWSYGTPAGTGGDPASGHTGTKVIGTVIASPGTYPANVPSAFYAKAPAINCSGYHGVTLDFWRWLRADVYDNADIQVSTNGSTWSSIWPEHAGVMETSWSHQTFDISSIADNHSTVYIRWGLGPTNATGNYGGWNIDDVTVSGSNDNTPPTVSARTPAAGSLVVSSSPNVDVTFSEVVQGVDATDLVLSGPAAASASIGTPTNVSGNTWRFPVAGLLSGALTMTLAPDAGDIVDVAGNNLAPTNWGYSVNVSTLIAYRWWDGNVSGVFAMHPDGTGKLSLSLQNVHNLAFSPDGAKMAYDDGGAGGSIR